MSWLTVVVVVFGAVLVFVEDVFVDVCYAYRGTKPRVIKP